MHKKPKKFLGQNFLIDHNIRRKIINACAFSIQDTVLEIGAGKGELSCLIAPLVKKFYALELDTGLCQVLEAKLSGIKGARVICQDILKFDLTKISAKNRLKVIGNIPYYISSPIIERLAGYKKMIDGVWLTVQKEYAERISAFPDSKKYGSFSCFAQFHFIPDIIFSINKNCFYPQPKIDSSFIRLSPRRKAPVEVEDEERLFRVIRASFSQRRKTLRNSLKGVVSSEKIGQFLAERGLDRNSRPETLSLADFAILAKE
jgi:16S rRNA (adenine1518-N6/adenine1519-N6)-dimethyltransferase